MYWLLFAVTVVNIPVLHLFGVARLRLLTVLVSG